MFIFLLNELHYFVSVYSPERDYVVCVAFPNEQFKGAPSRYFGFKMRHKFYLSYGEIMK